MSYSTIQAGDQARWTEIEVTLCHISRGVKAMAVVAKQIEAEHEDAELGDALEFLGTSMCASVATLRDTLGLTTEQPTPDDDWRGRFAP